MKTNKVLLAAAIALGIVTISGCAQRPDVEETTTDNEVQTVTEMEGLDSGAFYIYHGDNYEKPYASNANYNISQNSTGWDAEKILWFKEDFNKVPTLYKGDKLVYKTTDDLNETFSFERFEYLGYTIGLSRLGTTKTGRIMFYTDIESGNINPQSDAVKLANLTTSYAIIDKIGGVPLMRENLSPGGVILNLERDKSYKADVYAGTILNEFSLVADSLALASMDYYSTLNYTFLRSDILEIEIPEWFNSGYYMINGFGLFRYVNGTDYDEKTDFNIPNVNPDKSYTNETDTDQNTRETAEVETDENGETILSTEEHTASFTLEKGGNYTLIVTLKTAGLIRSQQVFLRGEGAEYQLAKEGTRFYLIADLDPGSYEIYATNTDAEINYSLEVNSEIEEGTGDNQQKNIEPEGTAEN